MTMVGRRRDVRADGDAARLHGANHRRRWLPAQREPTRSESTAFRLSEDASRYPATSPAHPGYEILFSFARGGEVTVATPEYPGAAGPVFWMLDLPPGQWTRLVDQDGRSIPVELLFEDGLATARWC